MATQRVATNVLADDKKIQAKVAKKLAKQQVNLSVSLVYYYYYYYYALHLCLFIYVILVVKCCNLDLHTLTIPKAVKTVCVYNTFLYSVLPLEIGWAYANPWLCPCHTPLYQVLYYPWYFDYKCCTPFLLRFYFIA